MAQSISQNQNTHRNESFWGRSIRRASANSSGSSQTRASGAARSSDSVQLSRGAQAAAAADQVRSVLNGLGFSTGTTARNSADVGARRNSGFGASAGVNARARVGGSSGVSERAGTTRSSNSTGSTVRNVVNVLDAASILNPVTAPLTIGRRAATLIGVETGLINPDRSSRLGAFEATAGNERGTTGRAAHNSIGGIYMLLGNFGEDQIGNVFNSREARQEFGQSLSNGSSRRLAEMEHGYWDRQRQESGSAGGYMGSAFSPQARDMIQQVMGRF